MPMLFNQESGSPVRGRNIVLGLKNCGATIGVCSAIKDCKQVDGYPFFNFNDYSTIKDCLDVAIEVFQPDIIFSVTIGLLDLVSSASSRHGVPFVVDVHGIRTAELFAEEMPLVDKFKSFQLVYKWELSIFNAKYVIAANPMLGLWLGRITKRVETVAGIVNDDYFNIQPAYIDGGLIHFFYSGNFSKYQGVDTLLEAITLLPQHFFNMASFTLQGTSFGIAANHLFYHKALDMGRVHDVLPVSSVDYPTFLSQYHVSIIPRPWSLATYLAFPQKLAEGLASGRFIVASSIAPHRKAIINNKNGFLYKGGASSLSLLLDGLVNELHGSAVAAVAQDMAQCYKRSLQCQRIYSLLSLIL